MQREPRCMQREPLAVSRVTPPHHTVESRIDQLFVKFSVINVTIVPTIRIMFVLPYCTALGAKSHLIFCLTT